MPKLEKKREFQGESNSIGLIIKSTENPKSRGGGQKNRYPQHRGTISFSAEAQYSVRFKTNSTACVLNRNLYGSI